MTTGTDPGRYDVVAAGAVLWRPRPSATGLPDGTGAAGVEIALVHRPRYDDWSLPKGKLDKGETPVFAAARELTEETGYTVALGVRLGHTEYPVPEGDKIVYYWTARVLSGDFTPNHEVDELRWVTPEDASGLLSHPHDADLVERFRAVSPPARPLLLVRHAKAGDRATWTQSDDLRPLTGKGRRQAEQLADLLPLFAPDRVYAAPPVRCPQTIQPLADRLGLAVLTEPLLGEEDYWADPDAGVARLLELAAGPDVAAICSQGGVIPHVVAQLAGVADPPSRKASTWVLGFSGDELVSADYYDEPTG